uniref:CHK kinase-like domain-containing protein n=1 Tax=Anopheles epiroticus TaxID=199890 RepID=A0A240PKZ1_9DIPT
MTSSASADVSVPEWMTAEYFTDAIAVKLDLPPTGFSITELDVRRATEAGDNYASVLYRVRVTVRLAEGDQQTVVSLIVKALPKLSLTDEMVKLMNLFPKEIAMYTDVLPALERLYHELGRTSVSFGPRCLKHSTEPTDVIVLEDLRERQFTMANRRQGLDMEHTRMVLRRLAQFHAASAVLQEQRGPYGELFREGMFTEKGRAMSEQFQKGQAEFIQKIMNNWSEKAKYYATVMKHWGMDLFDSLIRVTRANPDRFNVLNHGDMWCNNILFHYNEESALSDILLIDYQLSFWSSPAIDLLYFMFTSVNGEFKLSQLNYMIQYYHEHLVDSLEFLGYSGTMPLLKELHSDIISHYLFGFMICFSILPICLMEKTDDASMDLMLDQGDAGMAFKLKMYNNPAYVQQMEQLLEYFYDMGVYDLLQIGTQRTARIDCDDSLELPLWLDREFVEHIVDSKFGVGPKEKRTIISVHVKNAAKKGDSYASTLYSVKVQLRWKDAGMEETLSLIVKAPPKGIAASYSLDKEMYVRELYLYEQLIPAFEALYRNKGASVKLGPRYYKPRVGLPVDVIVLEDLTASGYRMANRKKGLDKAHVEVVLSHLAQFHAASAVYCDAGNTLPAVLTESSSDRQMAAKTDHMFEPSLDSLFKYMREWDFARDYVGDLETVSRQIYQLLVDTTTLDPAAFNVLNHGDAWLNNMMFAYTADDDVTVDRMSLIDYQFPAWGSPVLDLIHFLFSSVRAELKLSKQAYFLRFYQERLVQNLVLLGYGKPLPTLQQLHLDFNDRLTAAIKTVVIDLPYVLADPTEDASQEAAIVQTEAGRRFQQLLFDSELFKAQMKVLLPYFRSRGLLTTLAASSKKRNL